MKYILTTLICLLIAVPAMTQYPAINYIEKEAPAIDYELLKFTENIAECQKSFNAGFLTEDHFRLLLQMHLRSIKMHINNYCALEYNSRFGGWHKFEIPKGLEPYMIDSVKSWCPFPPEKFYAESPQNTNIFYTLDNQRLGFISRGELQKELREILRKNREDFIDNNELWFLIQGQRELDDMKRINEIYFKMRNKNER